MRRASIASLVAAAVTAQAEGADVASGQRLAQIWCGSCHQIGVGDSLKPTPSLPELARLWSAEKNYMRTSLANMPNFMLTEAQIKDISAYVSSLKGQ